MSQIVVTNEGGLELATNLFIRTSYGTYNYLVDLYINDYQPSVDSTAGDFVIANFQGYTQVVIPRAGWDPPTTVEDEAFVQYANNPIQWSNNGPLQTVYGYLVTSSETGAVLWAQQFATPAVVGLGKAMVLNLAINLFGSGP